LLSWEWERFSNEKAGGWEGAERGVVRGPELTRCALPRWAV
jgi:hypothetical protein